MKLRVRSLLGFLLVLCLCLALFGASSPRAAAETGIGKVLLQTGNGGTTPVVWMEVQYLPRHHPECRLVHGLRQPAGGRAF